MPLGAMLLVYHARGYRALGYHALSYRARSCHALSYHALSCHALSYHTPKRRPFAYTRPLLCYLYSLAVDMLRIQPRRCYAIHTAALLARAFTVRASP